MENVRYHRTPYLVVHHEQQRRKDVYGSIDDAVVLQAQLLRGAEPASTAIVAMHPIGSPGYLPAFSQLARAGFHVVACGTRYSTGDAPLQMENVLLDLAACVRDTRERLGYEKVILAGWSGGGSLMTGYQGQVEKRTIVQTAAGEPTALADAELPAADGLILFAAHRSRHHLLTEFLDPSILDESKPWARSRELNLYDPGNANQPPYSPEFLMAYREAQVARSRRITAYAQERLADLRRGDRPDDEHCFVVHGTMADPRWVDPSVDPNDRRPGWSYLGEPQAANDGPAGLARFTTTRSWLSQWSLDTAQVDSVDAATRIAVPVLVIVNSADDAVPPTHPRAYFDALPHSDKEWHEIAGANHYLSGSPEQRRHLETAVGTVRDWAVRHGFAEPAA
jgi:pimeloyl-ACP methyl ester carboxylesterase